MPKQLLKFCALVLCLCIICAALLNFQIAGTSKSQRQLSLLDNDVAAQFDWVAILEQLPQYKQKIVSKVILVNKDIKQAQLSDGKIIGIVLDPPKSVLLYVAQSESLVPLQLTLGEGWLDNWLIKKINADSVVWFDSQSQQSYTQLLFNDANDQ